MFLPFEIPLLVVIAFLVIVRLIIAWKEGPWVEPKTIEIRPTLKGKELKEWTALYQANSITYQRASVMSASRVGDITWGQYENLTGREQWVEVPNPDYVEVGERA